MGPRSPMRGTLPGRRLLSFGFRKVGRYGVPTRAGRARRFLGGLLQMVVNPKSGAEAQGNVPQRAAAKSVQKEALEDALTSIEKSYGKGAIMRLGGKTVVPIEAISTGSFGLDLCIGGRGLPRGRVVEVFGPESSGKTTLTLHVVANAQRAGGIAAFIDAEHA